MRLRIFVEGLVQGVGFRAYTKRIADSYGLNGWVRNLPDGRVEILVEGDDELIGYFIKDILKGPPAARVDKAEIIKEYSDEPVYGFDIKYI
ncbi:MAG TPA: acylphosphatase [Aquifex aeolicus]|nr:acylphosphatase [Pyrodictium sp.]HIP42565.1 acylphosphatase [Aquifex aeolicus]